MSAKHTPGPWLIAGGTTVYALNVRKYNRFTASVMGGHDDNKWPIDDEEALANARLIAAAPDLLEAMYAIVASADNGHAAIITSLLTNARAAIAKATGEDA